MKITIQAGTLAKKTKPLAALCLNKGLPILGTLLLEAKNVLHITASDLEIESTSNVDADVHQPGQACIPAKQLHDAAASLPEDADISLSVTEGRASLSAGRARWTLPTLAADDFPMVSDPSEGAAITLNSAHLKAAISASLYAAGVNDVRHYLNGLLLEGSNGQLNIVGTDGHRMAVNSIAAEGEFQYILSRPAAAYLLKLDTGEHITINPCTRGLRFSAGETTTYAKVIDARFPDYRRVIPDQQKANIIKFDRQAMLDALNRVMLISTDAKKIGVRLAITPGQISLSTASADHSESDDQIDAQTEITETVDLNARYLVDTLKTLIDDTVAWYLIDGTTSTLFGHPDYSVHVVMPMR
jgi:DNA polymerase-3 subunit beta